jgi:putative aminopeptidase FrvX
MDFTLLKKLCSIPGTSGDEQNVRNFVLEHIEADMETWKNQPEFWFGDGFQDCLVLVFGKPKTAFYAHLDTVGYTIRYDNYAIEIGGPDGKTGDKLVFELNGKQKETRLICEDDDHQALVDYSKKIEPGTTLTYAPNFFVENEFVKSPYLDNRLGVWALLQIAPWAKDVALVFTTYEEHGGGTAGYIARLLFEKYGVIQSIISDVTWVTSGVQPGKGPVISIRDSRIPRKSYVDKIKRIAEESEIQYQLEVEAVGGSDGREIQHLPYPIDWCFIGPPSYNPHSSLESVHQDDINGFVEFLATLAKKL